MSSALRFSTDLGAVPGRGIGQAGVGDAAAPPPQQQQPTVQAVAAPVGGGDLLDRLQWHGLQSFMTDANKPQPLASAMGRAPPPKNVSMREAKMQQQGAYTGW